jgi:hypothetical protein
MKIRSRILTRRNKRIACMCVNRHVGILVNAVRLQRISGFHQDIDMLPTRMHCDPAGMVPGFGRLDAPNQRQKATIIFAVAPNSIGPHVSRVKKALRRVECHAVDSSRRRVFVILNILFQSAALVNAEGISKTSIVVEGCRVDVVRRSFRCKQEYRSRFSLGIRCFCYRRSDQSRRAQRGCCSRCPPIPCDDWCVISVGP